MAIHTELYKAYQNEYPNLLKQVKERTRCSDEETMVLIKTVLHKTREDESSLLNVPPDNLALYNWLRYHVIQYKELSDTFQLVSIHEQHRFCQYMKERLSVHLDTLPLVQRAMLHAKRDLINLVLVSPESKSEQVSDWIQLYLDYEIQIYRFTDIWEKLKTSLQWQAKGKTKTPEETEDLLQQTYFNALKYIRKHHKLPEEGKMKAWLAITMHHAFIDDVRDSNRIQITPLNELLAEHLLDEEDIEKRVIEEQGRKTIEQIIQTLLPEDRAVMTLYLLQDRPLSEIATLLNEKLETIRARFKRARPKFLAKLPAKSLAEYIKRSPMAQFKLQNLLQGFTPTKAPKGFRMADIDVDTQVQYEILVRYILSLHIEGHDSREIAELLTLEKEDNVAFAKRVAAIQMCLEENLPRLFSSFYGNQK